MCADLLFGGGTTYCAAVFLSHLILLFVTVVNLANLRNWIITTAATTTTTTTVTSQQSVLSTVLSRIGSSGVVAS